jgi:hypothetical protein
MTMQFRGKSLDVNPNVRKSENGTMADVNETVVVGLVKKEGSTRGKNPRKIEYLAFDQSVPASLPKSLAEFVGITKADEKELLEYAIDGFNSAAYSAASDEIGEFIPDTWDKETAAQFRLAVRNTSKLTGLDIEATVTMLKPAIEKGLTAKAEALKAQTTQTPA